MNYLFILGNRAARNYLKKVIEALIQIPAFRNVYSAESFDNALTITEFADGEMEASMLKTIRNKIVYIVAGQGRNSAGIDINKNKIEIFHIIDAVKRAGAKKIVILLPYFSSARSDRIVARNSVGFWIDYKILVGLGVNHIITFQLHSDKSKTVVDPTLCAIDDIPAFPLLQKYICDNYINDLDYLDYVRKNWVFCSVDAGGENVARNYAMAFGTDLVIAHKRRDYSKPNTISEIQILSSTPLDGKEFWIVDDMIDSGGSMCALLSELEKRGLKSISIAIAHPLFNGNSIEKLNDFYQKGVIKRILTLDTIEITDSLLQRMPYLNVVNTTFHVAHIISMLYMRESLAIIFEKFSAQQYLDSKQEDT